jgi:para-nitrobenzyl esterase
VPEAPQAQPVAQWPPPPRPEPMPLETTEALTWEGVLVGELVGGVDVYKGVRYAAPPVGERRFLPPGPPPEGDDIDALEFGWPCTDADPSIGSEDCLTLNVWAPRPEIRNTESPRPVIVHLLSEAPGTDHRLDGGDLAWNADAVVVTVNYRRGLLGFLAVPSMLDEAPAAQAGNFGLADVVAALTWIRDTVRTFSGDPDRVLLIGQGESAEVICHILAAPAAQRLFHAAAIQSGACGRRTRLTATPGDDRWLRRSGRMPRHGQRDHGVPARQAPG